MTKFETTFAQWIAIAISLCATTELIHAASQATFTDSWKDTAVPDAIATANTTGSFQFSISLPLEGVDLSEADTNSQFGLNIGPVGNPFTIISETPFAYASSFSASKHTAIFPLITPYGTTNGSVTVKWTTTTITVTGSSTNDFLEEEQMFASASDGIASDNYYHEPSTNEVDVVLDASDNGGGTFTNSDQNVPGVFDNSETEATGLANTIPLDVGLLSGTNRVGSTNISFSDSWKDTAISVIPQAAETTGSFSFSFTEPINEEVTTSDLNSNSQFSFSIGSVAIVADTLGDALEFKAGATGSAVFGLTYTNSMGFPISNGTLTVNWTSATLKVSAKSTADLLGEESQFAANSSGFATNYGSEAITNEVDVSLDAFDFDTNAVGKVSDKEKEYTNPSPLYTTFPLESGSMTGSSSGLSFSDTWSDAAKPAGYHVDTTGSASITFSLPLKQLDTADLDTNSVISLSIGPVGNPVTIFNPKSLGDATSFKPGSSGSATFVSSEGAANGTLKITWTPTTLTISGSTMQDALGMEAMFATNSEGVPYSETGKGFYEIALTLDASGNNGGTFNYLNYWVPVTGKNTETEQSLPNFAALPLESGTITGTADFVPPKAAFTSPPAGQKVYYPNSIIDLKGTASDSIAVAEVYLYINGDTNDPIMIDQESELPTNSITWTAEVDLSQAPGAQLGTNVFTLYAIDTSSNSALVTRAFYWIETNVAVLAVNPTNGGKISGSIKNGSSLQVGNGYSVTATPASKAWIFANWSDASGDILSSNATYEYIDTDDGTLTANFAPNPFYNASKAAPSDLAGTYTGLYFDTNNGPEVRNAGYITITVSATGAYSGQFYNADYGTSPYSLSGQMSVASDDSFATATSPFIKLGPQAYVQVILQLATDTNLADPGAGLLTGFVNAVNSPTSTNNPYTAEIQGELSLYNTNTVAGLYTIVIAPVSSDPSQGPGGYSWGSATVSNKKGAAGSVALVLNLADGTTPTISFSTALAQDGTCPIYAHLYGGNGVLLGWMQFATDGSGSMSQAGVYWLTAYDYTSQVYTNGFNAQPTLSGGLYVPPKAGTNIFGQGATSLTFAIDPGYPTGLNLPAEEDAAAAYNPTKNTFTDTNKVTISLTASTGAFSGSFPASPVSKTSFSYKGVVVDGVGYGFYTDTNKETGPISLGSAATADSDSVPSPSAPAP